MKKNHTDLVQSSSLVHMSFGLSPHVIVYQNIKQLHKTVIHLSKQGKVSWEIAKCFSIDKSTVNRIVTKNRSTNSLANKCKVADV